MSPDEEFFEEPFPTIEEMRPYVGKVVAYDAQGKIRLSADSWSELVSKLTDEARSSLTLMYLPPTRVIA
ncbi:MAG: hypothetical protein QM765_15875 [Myxococcales bacterium]